jgi:Flp pilus assembly protein TadD
VCDNLGDKVAALDNIREALEFEANNPRYLDYAIELAIAEKDLNFANSMLERLRGVNPDNAKLLDFEEEINSLTAQTNTKEEVLPNA